MNLKPLTSQPEAPLPSWRILRMPEVLEMTGLTRSQVNRMMAKGAFPSAIKLTERAIGWLQGDVRRWANEHHTT
jgi:prophage regulatory protein